MLRALRGVQLETAHLAASEVCREKGLHVEGCEAIQQVEHSHRRRPQYIRLVVRAFSKQLHAIVL
jgi:hypothetical protein